MSTDEFNLMLGQPCDGPASNPGVGGGGVDEFLVASCERNLDKLRSDGQLSSYADFTYVTFQNRLSKKMSHIKFN